MTENLQRHESPPPPQAVEDIHLEGGSVLGTSEVGECDVMGVVKRLGELRLGSFEGQLRGWYVDGCLKGRAVRYEYAQGVVQRLGERVARVCGAWTCCCCA